MHTEQNISELAQKTKATMAVLLKLTAGDKNHALAIMAKELKENTDFIRQENKKDVELAKENGLSSAMVDRLILNDKRMNSMISSVEDIIKLQDPVGSIIDEWKLENGLAVGKKRVPIGVIGIIYESRPNVTCDAATLCFKASNAVILRGGKESIHSNLAIVQVLKNALQKSNLPEDILGFIETTDRQAIQEMLSLNQYIDLIIPRGGKGLIDTVVKHSRIPVIKHYTGVCNLYIAPDAEKKMAIDIALNAKVQRPGVCNAIENLLFHKDFPYIRETIEALQQAGVEIRAEKDVEPFANNIVPATEEDYYEEYLDLILAVKLVDDQESAVWFIEKYGSAHSDGIITQNYQWAEDFLNEVDSSTVYVNASTRFTDGGQFGMGAEIGISTDKLHARGPMGLQELTTYKFIVRGNGQIRE